MKTKIIKKQPMIRLLGGCNWEPNSDVEVDLYLTDFRECRVGDVWGAYNETNCGRGAYNEQLTVVFKNEDGVACLHEEFGTNDNEECTEYIESELIWFEI